MKRFIFSSIILFISLTSFCQLKQVKGEVYYKEQFVKVNSAQVYLLLEKSVQDSFSLNAKKNTFLFNLDPDKSYHLKVKKEGYITEEISLVNWNNKPTQFYQLTIGKDTGSYIAEGLLKDGDKFVNNAYMWVFNTMTNELIKGQSNDSAYFRFRLTKGYDYQIWAKKAGFLKKVAYVNYCANKPKKNSKYCLKGFSDVNYVRKGDLEEPSLFLEMTLEPIDFEKTYTIDNIYYDLDKWFIRPDAARELNKIVKVMTDNPEISIELGSHTDCRAKNEYNLSLSQKRAQAAVDYLISKGISKDRMTAKGYGETVLVNKCADGVSCSEAMHQQNRRTEFRVTEVSDWRPMFWD